MVLTFVIDFEDVVADTVVPPTVEDVVRGSTIIRGMTAEIMQLMKYKL